MLPIRQDRVENRDKTYTQARRFFWRNFISLYLYRSFRSIILVIVIFLLGFQEFCCDAGSVFPWCDVDNQYRIPKQIKFEFTLPLDTYVTKRVYYVSLTILNPFLLHGFH